jgi:phenylpropionate dioxygenase-like ring-hydroxylating dioxygenase large terminal subunit
MNANLDRPAKISEPMLRFDSITGERYVSADWAKLEWKRMWMRTWNIGGVAYQAPEPGDYVTTELGSESIIMVRQNDGSFRAFFNACPHRGARIVQGSEGHAESFTCPYHAWEFDRAGIVTSVPGAADYRQGDPCGRLRLTEVRCEVLFGMIWFNMDWKAPTLKDYLGPTVVDEIGSYHMENMVRVLNVTADANCNWKLVTDNFNEGYHVGAVHPELIPYIEANAENCQFDLLPNGHNRGWFPGHMPGTYYQGEEVGEPLASIMREWGLDPSKYKGRDSFPRIRTDLQQQKRKLGPQRGYSHYETLADYSLTDYVIYNLFPNSVITVNPDGVQLLRPRPHATDPTQCLFDHWWFVPRIPGHDLTPSPAGGPDLPVKDAELDRFKVGQKTLGRTADQDLTITQIQQEGLGSAGFRDFYLCHQERRVQRFHETLNDYMRDR